MNVVVCGQIKNENSSLPVAVRVSKPRMLKLPYFYVLLPSRATRVSRWPRFRYCSPKIRQKLRLFCRLNEHAAWTLHEYYMNIHLHYMNIHAARAQHSTIAIACFISAHGWHGRQNEQVSLLWRLFRVPEDPSSNPSYSGWIQLKMSKIHLVRILHVGVDNFMTQFIHSRIWRKILNHANQKAKTIEKHYDGCA